MLRAKMALSALYFFKKLKVLRDECRAACRKGMLKRTPTYMEQHQAARKAVKNKTMRRPYRELDELIMKPG
jgi:hypothetical protein